MDPDHTIEQYEKKINLHDFDQLVPLISEDAVFWFNDGSHYGSEAIRTAFEQTWQKFPLESYWLEKLNWIARGENTACCTYHFRWIATIEGTKISGGGRGTTILEQKKGVWKIIHEHLSQFPPT